MKFYNTAFQRMNHYNKNSMQLTRETFKALVDAIIPRTPGLAEEYGEIQFFGALDLHTDEYMIWTLNKYYIPLAKPAAELLNIAAEQLVYNDGNEMLLYFSTFPGGGTFAALAPNDRFRALTLLEQHESYTPDLLLTFLDYPGLFSISSVLNRYTMMGYYSEWSGYGSTRLESPNQRILESFPISWTQTGYPGPSFSYGALVTDYYRRKEKYE